MLLFPEEKQIIVKYKTEILQRFNGAILICRGQRETQERWSWLHRDKPGFIGRDVVLNFPNIPGGRGWMVIGFYIYSHCYVCKNKTEYL